MLDEIIIKEISHPRLTLTLERMTIKFKEDFQDKERIILFANKIKNSVQSKIEHTLRGRFRLVKGNYTIDLSERVSNPKNLRFWEHKIKGGLND